MTIIKADAAVVEQAARELGKAREKMRAARGDLKDQVSELNTYLGDKHYDNIKQMAEIVRKTLEDGEKQLHQCEMKLIGLAERIRDYDRG